MLQVLALTFFVFLHTWAAIFTIMESSWRKTSRQCFEGEMSKQLIRLLGTLRLLKVSEMRDQIYMELYIYSPNITPTLSSSKAFKIGVEM